MHEMPLMKNLISVLEQEIKNSEIKKIKTIHLEIGALQHIAPDIIISHFEHMPKSEKLKYAKIDCKIVPVKIKCSNCTQESVMDDSKMKCSKCASEKVDIISGKEFKLKGIEW